MDDHELALQDGADILNEAQRIAGIGAFVWDLEHDAVRFSESMATIMGVDESHFQGDLRQAIELLVHPGDQEMVKAKAEAMIAQKRMWPIEFRTQRPDGTIRFVKSSAHFRFNADGDPVAAVGVVQDITAQREVEEEREITVKLLGLINSPGSTHELMRMATILLRDWSGCEAVGIRLRDKEDFPYFETRGFSEDFVRAETHLCERAPDGDVVRDASGAAVLECMCGNVLCERFDPDLPFFTSYGSFWTNSTGDLLASTSEEERQARTRNRCYGEGYESVALIPLRHSDEVFGLLQFNDKRRKRFTEKKILLLEHLAGSLSIALAQRKASEAVYENRKELRALLDATYESMALIEPDGCILECNSTFAERLNRVREEIIGKSVFDMIPPAVLEHRHAFFREVVECRKTVQFEDQRDGRYFHHCLCPVFNDQGQVRAVAIFAADISERKRAEQALRESERILDETGRMAKIGGWEHDLRTRRAIWTNALYDLIEIPCDQEPPGVDEHLDYYPPRERAILAEAYARAVEQGVPFDLEMLVHTAKNRRMWCHVQGEPVYEDGVCVKVRGTFRDITEQKQAVNNLARYTELLSSIREAQDLLIAGRDKAEVFRSLLEALVQLTDSEYGFLDEILTDEDGRMRRRSLATSIVVGEDMPRHVSEHLKADHMEATHPADLAGLPSTTGELVIANDVARDPRSGHIPEGQPPIRTYMGIPMHLGDQLIGVAGIANRCGGYDEQMAEFLTPFISTCAGIINALRSMDQEREYQQKLSSLVSELIHTEEQEQQRIADLLHDGVGQTIAFAKVKVDVTARSDVPAEEADTLREVSASLKEVIDQTRDLSFELSCPTLKTQGLAAAIREYLTEELSRKHGIAFEFDGDCSTDCLNDSMQLLLYRATRELLINVIKHSRASTVQVAIGCGNSFIEIHVKDDGVGFDADEVEKSSGFGLMRIRERLTLAGGHIVIRAKPGQGAHVELRAPLESMNRIQGGPQ